MRLPLPQRREKLEQFRDRPGSGGTTLGHLDVFDHGQVWKDQTTLGYVGNAGASDPMRWPSRDRGPVERHGAGARRYEAHDGLDGRRLADPVAPEQAGYAALRQLEIDALQDVAGAVMRVETQEGEHYSIPPR